MAEEISLRVELDEWLVAEPFEAFFIIMNSGDRFEINRLTQVAVGTETTSIFRADLGALVPRLNQIIGLHKP